MPRRSCGIVKPKCDVCTGFTCNCEVTYDTLVERVDELQERVKKQAKVIQRMRELLKEA